MKNNNSARFPSIQLAGYITLGSLALSLPAQAYEMADLGHSSVNANVEALLGAFHSGSGYNPLGAGTSEDRSHRWQEGVLKLGMELAPHDFEAGGLYGQVSVVQTATWGDGDAAGFSTGDERKLDMEDAYLGYRHTGLGSADTPWHLDISAGRQTIQLGDGFLIAGDALNLGSALGDELDRGGAYWLAGRQAFDRTASLTVGTGGWQGRLFWLESDNVAQAFTELGALAVQHDHGSGLWEASYLHGLGVDEDKAGPALLERDGMDVYSLRGEQALLDEALNLRGEYAHQSKSTSEDAWYLEPAWTFAELPGQPTVSLRYSRFSEQWDPLFYGFTRGYGTWFQGEVAGNYAGPFNSNAEIWHLGVTGQVNESLSLGLLAFDFDTLDSTNQPDMSGNEINLYAEWFATGNLYVSPLLGWYDPDKSATEGGTQLGDDDSTTYAQLVVGFFL